MYSCVSAYNDVSLGSELIAPKDIEQWSSQGNEAPPRDRYPEPIFLCGGITFIQNKAFALPFGLSRLFAGLVFCLGLILVVLGGAELFTGNTLMVMALGAGEVRLRELLRAWLIVYVGNFIGAGGTALLVYLAGQHLSGDGAVAAVALKLAVDKVALPFERAFFMGKRRPVPTFRTGA